MRESERVEALELGALEEGAALEGAAVAVEAAPAVAPFGRVELAIVVVGALYVLGPWRRLATDLSAFGLGAIALALAARAGRLPPRAAADPARAPRALLALGAFTLLGVTAQALLGAYRGIATFRLPLLLATCLLYLPFAYLQQVLTQRYITDRLGVALGRGRELGVALWAGLLFGLAHLPFPDLVPPTLLMGVLWSATYRISGRILPVAISHALLGATYFLSVIGRDPFRDLGLGL
ncbi:MAG: CPBP family intramembrane glutamic endopeptidase [Planctomycetota bacterium]